METGFVKIPKPKEKPEAEYSDNLYKLSSSPISPKLFNEELYQYYKIIEEKKRNNIFKLYKT